MFRIALLALIVAATPIATAQPTTDAAIDAARADIARFCAAEIQAFVKARKAEVDPNRRKTPEQEVVETFENLLDPWGVPPDLNLAVNIEKHAEDRVAFKGFKDPTSWPLKVLAEDRMRICINGRATKHYGERQTFVYVQNKTASTSKFMSGDTNWGEIEPGKTMLKRFTVPGRMTFRISVDGVDAYGPTTVEMKSGETLILSFGDAGKALTVAQPPPLD